MRGSSVRGFTLIELLISAAIISIISAIVIVRFNTFDSTVLLKSLAYEVAASIRQAQVYSVSVLNTGGNFSFPYGMTFSPESKTYTFFRYDDSSNTSVRPKYDAAEVNPHASDVNVFTIGRSMQIVDVCMVVGGVDDCTISRLDISFRRPEFKALFYAAGFAGDQKDITSGKIKLQSTNGGNIWIVEVGYFGQISVKKQ